MKFDVVSFGSAVIDTFVNTDVKENKGFIEYPVGSKLLIKEHRKDIGGGGTNISVALSRLGFKTGCISNVGNDNNGKDILKQLKNEKVKFLGSVKEGESGYSIILDSENHNRTVLTYKGPNNEIKFGDIPEFETKWAYLTSMMGTSYETQKKLAKKLHKRGVKIVFNPSSYFIKEKNIEELFKFSYAVIMNREEAEMIKKKYEKKGNLLKAIASFGPEVVVITDRDEPAWAYYGEQTYLVEPNKEMDVVERTGAGDAFGAGFTAGLILNYPLDECLKLGLEEGESVLGHYGAKNDLIKRNLKK